MLTKYALIVAGGKGERMNALVPKQFLLLNKKPVLIHTLIRFAPIADHIILVLPEEQLEIWGQLSRQYKLEISPSIVVGGSSRFASVKNGLKQLEGKDGLVAIHDAVRPFVSGAIIEESYRYAEEKGSGVVAVPVKDSIRKEVGGKSEALDRKDYRLMQTPQTFRLPALLKAYENASSSTFTDDASVFEADGNTIFLIEGAYENIKITTPEDIYLGEAILKYQQHNTHSFKP